jgi:cardiolipin synthase
MVWLLLESKFLAALGVFAMMGISDGLDGFLAKRYSWRTSLGEFLDPLADKTMLVSAFVTLGYLALIPFWLVSLIIVRDIIILTGALAYHLMTHRLRMAPSIISKFNTLAQIVLVLAVVFNQIVSLPPLVLTSLIGLTLFTTVASGLGYVIEWSARAKRDVL